MEDLDNLYNNLGYKKMLELIIHFKKNILILTLSVDQNIIIFIKLRIPVRTILIFIKKK